MERIQEEPGVDKAEVEPAQLAVGCVKVQRWVDIPAAKYKSCDTAIHFWM